jgi:predicted GNAT family N-acyltransferase
VSDAGIEVREATSEEDRRALFRLRREVYVEELHFQFEPAGDELHDPLDDEAILLLAAEADEIVGTARMVWGGRQTFTQYQRDLHDIDRFLTVVGPEEIVIFERLMVRLAHRGDAAPLLLIKELAERSLDLGATVLLLAAQPHLVHLYERLALRPYLLPSPSPLGVALPLAALAQDLEYGRAVGSPFADYAAEHVTPADPARLAALRALFPERAPVRTEIAGTRDYRAETIAALDQLPPPGLGAPIEPLEELLDASLVVDCPPGITLFVPGMVQQTLYLVLAGQVDVFDGGVHVGGSGPGSFTGEVAFLLAQPRISEVRAGPTGVTLLGFNVASLRGAVTASPEAAAVLYRAVAADLARKLVERGAGAPAAPANGA